MSNSTVRITTRSGSTYSFSVENNSGLRNDWGVPAGTPATRWAFVGSTSKACDGLPMCFVHFGQHYPVAGEPLRFRTPWGTITSTRIFKIEVDGEVESEFTEEQYQALKQEQRVQRAVFGAFARAFG